MMKRLRAAGEEEEVKILEMEKNNVANFLLLLSQYGHGVAKARKHVERTFECRTCYRQFPSFQALGGHCTTHKRSKAVEGALSSTAAGPKKQPRRIRHECAICGMVFGMGQALGGHMRRHKPTVTEDLFRSRGSSTHDHEERIAGEDDSKMLLLDLNLPPPEEDFVIAGLRRWY